MESVNPGTEKSFCTARFRSEISALFAGVIWSAFWSWAVLNSGNLGQDVPLWLAAWGVGVCGTFFKPGRVLQLWVLLISLLLLGIGQWFWGMAFYCGISGIPEKRYRLAWCAGIISGGLFGSFFNIFHEVIGVLTAFQIVRSFPGGRESERSSLWFKLWHHLTAIAVLFSALWMLSVKPLKTFYPVPAPVTVASALGLCNDPAGEMLIVAPDRSFQIEASPVIQLLSGRIKRSFGVPLNAGKFKVVMAAGNLSAPGRLLELLESDGVLVLPVELCRKLPQLHWYRLPGADGHSFAAARLNGELEITPDIIEKNLLAMFPVDESSPGLLPGAISGALTGCESARLEFDFPINLKQFQYILAGAVFLLILLELLTDRIWPMFAAAGSGAFAFTLLAGMAMHLAENINLPYVNCACLLLLLLAAAGNADLPLSRNLLRISLLLMAAAMWLWFYRPSLAVLIVFLLLSLLVVASSGQLWRTGKEFETVQMAYILICAAGGFWLGGALAGYGMVLFSAVSALIVWRLLKS